MKSASCNPVAAAAGLKTMEVLRRDGAYDRLRAIGARLQRMQVDALSAAGLDCQICGDETLFDLYFTTRKVTDYRTARHDDPQVAALYNAKLRAGGVLKAPGKLYPSLAISEEDIEETRRAVNRAVQAIAAR